MESAATGCAKHGRVDCDECYFDVVAPDPPAAPCSRCGDESWVCENHPDEPWEHVGCGGAGMPCPDCNTEEPPRFGPGVLAVE